MQKIIDAQGPSACRTDLGTLTADVLAVNDGVVEAIDCLRLNRLARTAGAPIDKGAGIKVFKKIGDRVDKGEPLYRIHAFDQSEFDLAVAAAKDNPGYVIDGQIRTRIRDRSREHCRHPQPAVWRQRCKADCGAAGRSHARNRIAPIPGWRIAGHDRAGRSNDDHLCTARSTERQARCAAASPAKRCGATVPSASCWSRPISVICARMRRFIRARPSAKR